METFIEPKPLVENPHFQRQRRQALAALRDEMIDEPIIELVNAFNRLPYCFTLQCCYGHFVYEGQKDPHNLAPLPRTDALAKVEYRIAYLAFCLDNSASGRTFFNNLQAIKEIDRKNIQCCSATWFWERQVNSYALQVEPERFKDQDTAILDYQGALRIEKTRGEFFVQLLKLVQKQQLSLTDT